jgi:hypothetical protein
VLTSIWGLEELFGLNTYNLDKNITFFHYDKDWFYVLVMYFFHCHYIWFNLLMFIHIEFEVHYDCCVFRFYFWIVTVILVGKIFNHKYRINFWVSGLYPSSGVWRNMTFQKLDLFPSSGKKVGGRRHLLSWAP